jgi:hypothetical protein
MAHRIFVVLGAWRLACAAAFVSAGPKLLSHHSSRVAGQAISFDEYLEAKLVDKVVRSFLS